MNMNKLKAFMVEKIADWCTEIKRCYNVDATLNQIVILPNSNCQNIVVDYTETVDGVTTRKVDHISIWEDFTMQQVYEIWSDQDGYRVPPEQYAAFNIK